MRSEEDLCTAGVLSVPGVGTNHTQTFAFLERSFLSSEEKLAWLLIESGRKQQQMTMQV